MPKGLGTAFMRPGGPFLNGPAPEDLGFHVPSVTVPERNAFDTGRPKIVSGCVIQAEPHRSLYTVRLKAASASGPLEC